MGEARARQAELGRAESALVARDGDRVQLEPMQALVVMNLDLACSILGTMAGQFQNGLQMPEPAAELLSAFNHLQKYRTLYLARAQSRVLLASPSDLVAR